MKARYLLLALAALSCAEPSAPRPQGDLFDGLPLPPPPVPVPLDLVRCSPLAYDSVTQTIGPEPATLQLATRTLSVPPGAPHCAARIPPLPPQAPATRTHYAPPGPP